MKLFVDLISFFIALPFLAFVASYYLIKLSPKYRERAFNIAINTTTICLFISVSVMFQSIVKLKSGVLITLLILFLLMAILTFLQWNLKRSININKIVKGSFKLWFIFLIISYIFLFFIGIIKSFTL
jgi:hypothetical protein